MKLNKNKRIGEVIFIVEGEKHEFNLIKRIFTDVLGYTQIQKRRGKADYYIKNKDKYSKVAVINTKTSNIASINEKEYLDNIFAELIEIHKFNVNNAAIYYLFDRDPESNVNAELILGLIHTLKNSRENENNINGGMLILSYPSIESYEVSNFVDQSYKLCFRLGVEMKEYINSNAKTISMNKINEESIIHAVLEMKRLLENNNFLNNIPDLLEDFSIVNENVFKFEEKCLYENNSFYLLSMLSCVLLDLGILY